MTDKNNNAQCETCAYYDYDDESAERVCNMNFDEDELVRFASGTKYSCPYYKFYDEYKFVQKQN